MRTLVSALYLINLLKLDAPSTFIFQLERLAELIHVHVNLVRYVTVSLWNEFSRGAAPPHYPALQAAVQWAAVGVELVELYNTCK